MCQNNSTETYALDKFVLYRLQIFTAIYVLKLLLRRVCCKPYFLIFIEFLTKAYF